jgi:hypothetical protein
LVWSSAKLEEAGLWLKSTDTSFCTTSKDAPSAGPAPRLMASLIS